MPSTALPPSVRAKLGFAKNRPAPKESRKCLPGADAYTGGGAAPKGSGHGGCKGSFTKAHSGVPASMRASRKAQMDRHALKGRAMSTANLGEEPFEMYSEGPTQKKAISRAYSSANMSENNKVAVYRPERRRRSGAGSSAAPPAVRAHERAAAEKNGGWK
jgi:hypothetical protein